MMLMSARRSRRQQQQQQGKEYHRTNTTIVSSSSVSFLMIALVALFFLTAGVQAFTAVSFARSVLQDRQLQRRRQFTSFASTQEDIDHRQQQQQQQQDKKASSSSPLSLYKDYATRLWSETNLAARRRVSKDRTSILVHQLQQCLQSTNGGGDTADTVGDAAIHPRPNDEEDDVLLLNQARHRMLQAFEDYIKVASLSTLRKEEENERRAAAAVPSLDWTTGGSTIPIHKPSVVTLQPHQHHHQEPQELLLSAAPTNGATNGAANTAVALSSFSSSSSSSFKDSLMEKFDRLHPMKRQKKKKQRRSIMFGAAMGAVVAAWVFSGSYIFTAGFTAMTILGQLEYYRMIMNTGVYPARRISVVGACSMFLTALFTPSLHQICLPIFGLYSMVWFLTMKRTVTTIPEIATTFTGMFYLGYVPSFWVRIYLYNEPAVTGATATTAAAATRELTRLAPIMAPVLAKLQALAILPPYVVQAIHSPITTGSIFIFWTWLALAFSDVAAYFVGKNLGRTKLGRIAPAAGATSPNKTVEGVLGGCAIAAMISVVGAWVQKWPYPIVTGLIHGSFLGLIGLIGDLTASMLKRDAGLKDFGDLLPEHGGIMDRVDSFVWTAPYAYIVCGYVIPALKKMMVT